MKKRLWTLITIGITLVLLALVVREVGTQELVTVLTQADPLFLALAFVLATVIIFFGAIKWHILLRSQSYDVPLTYLIKLYFVGLFFNNFLPTNVGGDVVRAFELGKRINNPAASLASVFVERFTGFVVLIVVACFGFVTHISQIDHPLISIIMVLAVVGMVALLWVALDSRLLDLIDRLLPLGVVRLLTGKFRKFQNALYEYRGQRRALVLCFFWSFVFYAGAILYAYTTSRAFFNNVDLLGMAFVNPIAMVVAMMPFTFNGIGLQEWAYVLLFPLIGVPASVGLSSMLVIRVFTLILAIVGGIFYLQMKANDAAQKDKPVVVASAYPAAGRKEA